MPNCSLGLLMKRATFLVVIPAAPLATLSFMICTRSQWAGAVREFGRGPLLKNLEERLIGLEFFVQEMS